MTDRVLMKGNEALAEAAIRAGCRHFFGYPITPQTELAAYMSKKMPKIGGTYLQAESEVSAINMVLGAAAAGARVLTSSSSPGISLKTEGISYIAGSDLPCLIINVQRGGPGLGGIQPSQADYWQATRALGHGDFHVLVFAPNMVQELVDMVFTAYDLAEKYRMPAVILSDGLLGQMMEPVSFPDVVNLQQAEKPWAVTGHENKRQHNIVNSLYLKPDELEKVVLERFERYKQVEVEEQRFEEYLCDDAQYFITAFGASSRIAKTAIDMLRAEGIKVGMIRPITLWPFPKDIIRQRAKQAKGFLSVEMSMGQMVDDVRLVVNGTVPVEFFGRTGGMIPTPVEVANALRKMAGGDK
ncbi:MAG: 3-methyl-2-oxobutanoate dehydrogenase subunit VorB [Angelakisella sp.]|nr:3-methyl-2-oxobutanoate dehydrogenase subunit VorB [Angelakisella sp.]